MWMVDASLCFFVLISSLLPKIFSAVRNTQDSELFMSSHGLRCVKGAFSPQGFHE